MLVAGRISTNEARFAAANDQIAEVATTLEPRPRVPFLCECPDPRCSTVVELSLGEYAAVRLFAQRYLVSARCRGGELAHTLLVETNDRYTVVDRLD
jgi:hypothetical protein